MGANPKAQAKRETSRKETTANIMEGIMEGGEISKKREAELAKASKYGRGIQLTDKGQTGQRIVASTPTFGELFGDAGRALVGGQAEDPQYLREEKFVDRSSGKPEVKKNYAKDFLAKPAKEEGIIPSFVKRGGAVGSIVKGLVKKPKKEKVTTQSILAKKRQGFKDDPYSVPSLLLGGSKQNLGDS